MANESWCDTAVVCLTLDPFADIMQPVRRYYALSIALKLASYAFVVRQHVFSSALMNSRYNLSDMEVVCCMSLNNRSLLLVCQI